MNIWKATRQLLSSPRDTSVYGINRRNVELIYAHNRRRDYPLADDKLLTKEHLQRYGVPTPATIATCRGLFEVAACLQKIEQRDSFVIKPSRGSGGDGILVAAERRQDGWVTPSGRSVDSSDLRDHLANIVFGAFSKTAEDVAIVEERLVSSSLLRQSLGDGLPDLRFITLRGRPVLAMLRVATRESNGRANLHQGGIGVAVDLDTGRTTSARLRRTPIFEHPDTGDCLLGIQLPHYEHALEIARKAAESVPLGYLGIDVAIDDHLGPVVLEINARPGLEIQNVHRMGLGTAIQSESFR